MPSLACRYGSHPHELYPGRQRNRPHGVADNLVAREFAAATQALLARRR